MPFHSFWFLFEYSAENNVLWMLTGQHGHKHPLHQKEVRMPRAQQKLEIIAGKSRIMFALSPGQPAQ